MDAFRKALYGEDAGKSDDESVAKMILTLAVMLGNKWLEDNTFTTRTW